MSYQEIHEDIRRQQESQTRHTPLPWYLSEKRIAVKGHTPQGYSGVAVATTSPQNTDETRRADAEFIVRACNAHDVLLAACEAALELRALERESEPGMGASIADHREAKEAARRADGIEEQLRAAIKKAEGEQ
jgi:hypothetical protein